MTTEQDILKIGNRELKNRFFLGTGKFGKKGDLKLAIKNNGIEVVTVAMRRIDLEKNEDNIISYIPDNVILMTNTSGARNANEAVRLARLAASAGYGKWVKIEVINDTKYLLPDNYETIKATEILAAEGFTVLPYISPDLYVARELVKVGAAAVMPLGSLIGTNRGIQTKILLEVLINEIKEVPIIVDAGIGLPSQAAAAMELGADAVLVNTAVALSLEPVKMATAFSQAVGAGRLAYLACAAGLSQEARASSPLTGFLYEQ